MTVWHICGCTSGGVYVPCICKHFSVKDISQKLWNQHPRELISTQNGPCKHKYISSASNGPTHLRMYLWSGGVYVPCSYSHARWEFCRWLGSLLPCLCDVFWVLINSLVCWVFCKWTRWKPSYFPFCFTWVYCRLTVRCVKRRSTQNICFCFVSLS